ncbi:putative aldouronate transport system permease protein [Paenibacillus rhizosphaerae]|uniref:Putative aldouronate transport system permease protein n=2 Tax=Paenibacillus rhizosphaerae TaxID=297318 RepID=A0A839TI60_9BACL|nr:putative aldouronate transport system permease protein [Paenibacillus rhizosphaerae]
MNDKSVMKWNASGEKKKRSKGILRRLAGQWQVQSMILPGILFIVVFSYIPMYGITIAFKEFDIFQGISGSPWVGFKQFRLFFESPDFVMIMKNTLVIAVLKLIFIFPAPIILALMLNEVRLAAFKRIVQTLTYLPHFISWVIVSGLLFSILAVESGSLNIALQKLNLIEQPTNWLSVPKYFYSILISAGIWKEIGFSSIVYLAAITGINPHLYEAAAMDGAGRFKQMVLVTLPSIAPVVTIFLILHIGNLLNAGFEDILAITNSGKNTILRDVSEVIDTYVYNFGVNQQRYSFATAAGLFKSIINVLLLWGANSIARRMSGSSLW